MSVLDQIIIDHALSMKNHADSLGEILREWAFMEKYGCYSCFDLIPGFTEMDVTEREFKMMWRRDYDHNEYDEFWGYSDREEIKRIRWHKHDNGIEVGWYWDGDGTLLFYVPELIDDCLDGTISNSDCKKDHGWEFGEK